MRILLTGAAGRLGTRLRERLSPRHDVIGVDRHRLDVADYFACRKLVGDCAPDIVLHPAAWTDVDGCALDPAKALRVNGLGTAHLAAITGEQGIPIVYVSSNEVFAGDQRHPYAEYDQPRPINAYGYSKWYGERAIAQVNPRHIIARTSWLFARGGGNFVSAILAAAAAGKRIGVVVNEVANPTCADDLAAAIVRLIDSGRFGIYHLVNEGAVSRWRFARFALDQAGYADVPIAKISRHEWERPSRPPEYSALVNIAGASIGIRLRPWQDALSAYLQAEAQGS